MDRLEQLVLQDRLHQLRVAGRRIVTRGQEDDLGPGRDEREPVRTVDPRVDEHERVQSARQLIERAGRIADGRRDHAPSAQPPRNDVAAQRVVVDHEHAQPAQPGG
jgi:hypothetical protein